MSEHPPVQMVPNDEDYTVYVVLHGEIAIYEDKAHGEEGLRLYAPVMPEHVYMAGPWLGERHIPQGSTLILCGTKPADEPDSLHKHTDTMIVFKDGIPNPVGSYFEIRLPRPRCISRGFTVHLKDVQPTGDLEQPPTSIDLHPILVYNAGTPDVYLDLIAGATFEGSRRAHHARRAAPTSNPVWTAGRGQNRYLSLHIFAEADIPVSKDHPDMAFQMAAQILGENGASIEYPPGENPGEYDTAMKGLHLSEIMMSLSDRLYVEGALGIQLRLDGNMDPFPLIRWDPLAAPIGGGTQGSCGPVGT